MLDLSEHRQKAGQQTLIEYLLVTATAISEFLLTFAMIRILSNPNHASTMYRCMTTPRINVLRRWEHIRLCALCTMDAPNALFPQLFFQFDKVRFANLMLQQLEPGWVDRRDFEREQLTFAHSTPGTWYGAQRSCVSINVKT